MSIDGRKLRVLAAITRTYLSTGEPVGSKSVTQLLSEEVSPATIRNDMASLFELGLLEQPHTSAGRIPSHHGLRMYLDKVMEITPLTPQEQQDIDAFFNTRNPDPESIMEEATKVLAEYTNCATISTTVYRHSAYVQKIELIPARAQTVVILFIASNGMIKSKVCRVAFDLLPRVVDFFTDYANTRFVGKSINEITADYINSIAVPLGEYTTLFMPLFTAIYDICRETSQGKIYQSGASNLLEYSELRNMANHVFRILNSHDEMMSLMDKEQSPITIAIGRENTHLELNAATVMIARYKIGEDSFGAIGLIGSVRMDYAKIIPHLEYFAKILGESINNTLEEQI